MHDIIDNTDFVYVHPGEIYITNNKKPVITILGSCISLIIYDRVTGTVGICHAIFPENKKNFDLIQTGKNFSGNTDYTDTAFYRLLYHFKAKGIDPKKTELKLFGGSIGLTGDSSLPNLSVGRLNVNTVKKLLKKEGLQLLAEDTGGPKGRKLIFNPETGEVFIQYLPGIQVSGKRS